MFLTGGDPAPGDGEVEAEGGERLSSSQFV